MSWHSSADHAKLGLWNLAKSSVDITESSKWALQASQSGGDTGSQPDAIQESSKSLALGLLLIGLQGDWLWSVFFHFGHNSPQAHLVLPKLGNVALVGVSGAITGHLVVPSHSQEQCWPALGSPSEEPKFISTHSTGDQSRNACNQGENTMSDCLEIARWPWGGLYHHSPSAVFTLLAEGASNICPPTNSFLYRRK